MKVATLTLLRTLQTHFLVSKASGGNFDVHVLLDRDLTTEPFALGGLFLVDVVPLGRQDLAAAFVDFDFALGTGPAAAAGAGDKHTGIRQSTEQLAASGDFDLFLVVDHDLDRSGGDQLTLAPKIKNHQREHDEREHHNAKERQFPSVQSQVDWSSRGARMLVPSNKLKLNATERHEGQRHQADGDERNS